MQYLCQGFLFILHVRNGVDQESYGIVARLDHQCIHAVSLGIFGIAFFFGCVTAGDIIRRVEQ